MGSSAAQQLSKKKTVATAQHLSRNETDAAAEQPNSPAAQQEKNCYISSAPQQKENNYISRTWNRYCCILTDYVSLVSCFFHWTNPLSGIIRLYVCVFVPPPLLDKGFFYRWKTMGKTEQALLNSCAFWYIFSVRQWKVLVMLLNKSQYQFNTKKM